jgi:hypothetical protein
MAHECSQCSFVPDAGTLLTYVVSREQRASAGRKPVFVGMFTMGGWVGHSGFYLFKCRECDNICVDYPHGYRGNGYIYIRCDRCSFEIIFDPREHRDVYKRENVVPPPTAWEVLKSYWKNRKKIKELRKKAAAETEAVEAMGVKVVEDADDLF